MKTIHNKKLLGCFIGIELALYISFILLDILGSYHISSVIKFASILLCLVMSIGIQILYEHFLDRVMLSIALSFTVFADIFLLFTDYYILGVGCFCIVQTVYLARIANVRGQMGRIEGRVLPRFSNRGGRGFFFGQMVVRILISCFIVGVLAFIKFPVDGLFGITVFYFISFIFNIVLAAKVRARTHYFQGEIRLGLFLAGLLLFFVCDIMVGAFNATDYLQIPDSIYHVLYQVSSIGMWVFYLPGQILITLS